MRGEVHDGNAFRRGGVSANAGLFATGRGRRGASRAPGSSPGGLARPRPNPRLAEARGLAWQGRRGAGSAISRMSERAFGHTGFTGTSVWIDPEARPDRVLLTNRIHPVVREIAFNEVRQRFHAARASINVA